MFSLITLTSAFPEIFRGAGLPAGAPQSSGLSAADETSASSAEQSYELCGAPAGSNVSASTPGDELQSLLQGMMPRSRSVHRLTYSGPRRQSR